MGPLGVGGEFCVKNACYYSKIILLITARFTSFGGMLPPPLKIVQFGAFLVYIWIRYFRHPPPRTILLKIDAI